MPDNLQMALILIQAALDVALIALVVRCIRQVKAYRRVVNIMTADSPAVATSAEVIAEWAEKYKLYAPGTPKHEAYRRRLIEVGYHVAD